MAYLYCRCLRQRHLRALTDRKKQPDKTSSGSAQRGRRDHWNNVEIAEILLYHRDLTTGLDLVSVETYLINKYNPDPRMQSTIAYLKPLSPKTT